MEGIAQVVVSVWEVGFELKGFVEMEGTPGEIKQDETPTDPTEGKTVGKIRAETDSTKLREFLGNLGSE